MRAACRSIPLQIEARSEAIDCCRRAADSHIDAFSSAIITIGRGDRAEMRRPPTVVRKPPLTATMTATATRTAANPRNAFLFRCLSTCRLFLRNRPEIDLAALDVELFLRLPIAHVERVRHDARAGLQLFHQL